MPGPVSDSYDPEFGTAANAGDVQRAIQDVVDRLTEDLGTTLRDIVGVVHGPPGEVIEMRLSERERRVIRFALRRALERV